MRSFFVLPFALIVNVRQPVNARARRAALRLALRRRSPGAPAFHPDPSAYRRLGDELLARRGRCRAPVSSPPSPTPCCWPASPRCAACSSATPSPTTSRGARASARNTLLMLVMLPFWTSFLLRVYAWMGLLDSSEVGLINQLLLALGVVAEPLPLLYNGGAVLVGMVYSFLPHGAAAVRQPGQARPAPARGGARPRRPPVDRLPARDPARCPGAASWPARCWCSFQRWASS